MKKRRVRIILILITTTIAILIFSITFGREMYYGKNQSLASFGLIHFSGYLFFLLMPVEMAFVYYQMFFSDWVMLGIAMGTAVVAQIIDYFIGLSFSKTIVNNLVGEKRILKAEIHIRKYGYLTVFLFNVLPLSSPIVAVVAGMLKYRFKDFIIYSLAGLAAKYIFLCLIF
jgi:membrane protein DedA with SNARE-associated domain